MRIGATDQPGSAKPDNVRLTGFLPDSDYVGLILASDAVIALTTMDHTMQRGAYEAVYLGRPVITSNLTMQGIYGLVGPRLKSRFEQDTYRVLKFTGPDSRKSERQNYLAD